MARYHRLDAHECLCAALKLAVKTGKPQYMFATYYGWTIDARKPPQQFVEARSDGTAYENGTRYIGKLA